jgi:predicted nucleotidyltransferase
MATDMTGHLPAKAEAALSEYLAALDDALAERARGVYVTGSAVLGDWQADRSDLDILVLTASALNDGELATLEELHATLSGRPYRDAVYFPSAALGSRDEGAAYPAAVDGVFHRARHRPEPVLWATLDRHGLTVRGPEAGSLGADPGADWLREWNQGNLTSYWRRWAANVRPRIAGLDPADPVPAFLVTWAALGPGRLHATITSGEIISKSAAAGYTAALLPQYAGLLDRAKAHRLGDDTVSFTVADGLAACDLIDAVVDDAGRATLQAP